MKNPFHGCCLFVCVGFPACH